jgi:Tripartite tricarboxylate transporter TctB family
MPKQNLSRGVVLAAIALAFGLYALRLPIGEFSQVGPGLFPLLVSGFLLVLALLIIAQSFYADAPPLHFNFKNIGVVTVSLTGFVVLSKFVNLLAGIVWLVFVAGLAAKSYSWMRNIQITVALALIALAFQKLLGFNLKLI